MSKGETPYWPYFCLALLLFFFMAPAGCKVARESHRSVTPSAIKGTEQLIIDLLARVYERPSGGEWKEGKTYFLPEKHGIELLQDDRLGPHLQGLKVYRAVVWSVHWGPEKFPVLVWAVGSGSHPQLGVLEEPDQVASAFPIALRGLTFDRPEERESLALLIGKMVSVFYSEKSTGRLQVTPEGTCEWAEQAGARKGTRRRVAASCFSEGGVLEKIILPERDGG